MRREHRQVVTWAGKRYMIRVNRDDTLYQHRGTRGKRCGVCRRSVNGQYVYQGHELKGVLKLGTGRTTSICGTCLEALQTWQGLQAVNGEAQDGS